jgi:polysaccharide export outer membrane protein
MKINDMRTSLMSTAALLALAACGSTYGGLAGGPGAVAVQSELPAPDSATFESQQQVYRIGPLDKVSINVFGAQDLSREVIVDASGTVSVPLIGEVRAAGLTTKELGETIADRLRGRYVKNPQVSVGLNEIRSQRVTVDGAVNQPGIYPVIGKMSLLQAIAGARGATEYAALDRVAIFRTVNDKRMAALFSLRDIREGRYADPQVYANDVIVVGESGSKRFMKDVLQSIPVLGVFTPLAR